MTVLHGCHLHVSLSSSRTPCYSHVDHLQGLTMVGTAILKMLCGSILCNNSWPRKIASREKFLSLLHLKCDSGILSLQHFIAFSLPAEPLLLLIWFASGTFLFHVSHPLLYFLVITSWDKLPGHKPGLRLYSLGPLGAQRGHHRLALWRNTKMCAKCLV